MSLNNDFLNSSEDSSLEEKEDSSEQRIDEKEPIGAILSDGLTMDKLIEKIVPIVGIIFFTIGLGYLIYTNAWVNLPMEGRLALGFFVSLAVIGGSFSLSEKMKYFTDLGIGAGVLLLYGTLIYGSRSSDVAVAVIPELATLFTAFLFIIAVAFFASKRNSRVIIVLGMIGAYITPFVIGQNEVWVQNISFNAYLIYFAAINAAVFLLAREISIRRIIPLNIIGLFVGTSTIYHLSYAKGLSAAVETSVLSGETFTALLFAVLLIFLSWSVLVSARQFEERDDGYLALGYLAPLVWFMYNISKLEFLSTSAEGFLYAMIAVSSFFGWHFLRGLKNRFQHVALYAVGLLSSILAFFAFFPDLDVYSSIAIAYLSLVFAVIYLFGSKKTERFVAYLIISFMGSFLSLAHILDTPSLTFRSLHVVVALLPAMLAYVIARLGQRPEFRPIATFYSAVSFIIALMFVLADLIDYIDLDFLLFYVAPLLILLYVALFKKKSAGEDSHEAKSNLLKILMVWFALGYVAVFIRLIGSIYPAPVDTYLFTHLDRATDWTLVKGIFAPIVFFLGLLISRRLQTEQKEKRPSFVLVLFGFASLVLIGNYVIYAAMNDLQVSMAQGGPRAIATTLWWLFVAIYMLFVGIKFGEHHRAEKLLGLILLAITVMKVLLYDISVMDMQNKVFVLMVVGAALVVFSYGVQAKGWLKKPEVGDGNGEQSR